MSYCMNVYVYARLVLFQYVLRLKEVSMCFILGDSPRQILYVNVKSNQYYSVFI